jgi:tRNA(Ile)-lysidine synthase
MPNAGPVQLPSRKDPVVRCVVGRWRALAGGSAVRDPDRRTLVACSGGADSSALVLALATVAPAPVVAHVLHDLRPQAEARADRDRAAELARALGLEFVEGEARVASAGGNAEANARRARERALAGLALACGLRFVATGHHADDQLETVLMRLLRGAGPRGLSGIRPARALGGTGLVLVRPMLVATREEARGLCRRCGWAWAEDGTNRDESRLRAALRARVLPALASIEPEAAHRVVRAASVQASAHAALAARAGVLLESARVDGGRVSFVRSALRGEPAAVLGELVVQVHHTVRGGHGLDRVGERAISSWVRAVRSGEGSPKTLCFGGLRCEVRADLVIFE